LLKGVHLDGEDDSEDPASTDALQALDHLTPAERLSLEELVHHLKERPSDPKFDAVCHYLLGEPGWLELGCIVFSQYYDTAAWIAESLSARIPGEPIAVYAGADRSGLRRDGQWISVERDILKGSVRRRELRLVVATDAACEGLNLQTLGTLINVDLPWNPSRLEQRIGRIKRIGQVRSTVDMLNLVYQDTRDEKVYERLSRRMKDRYDLFGGLPDVIEDDWIEDIETLDLKLSEYIDKQRRATAFELRYSDTIDPPDEPWERCSQVLSRRDIAEHLSRGW
jgi:superfamily II DNA/RNA helicase